ncbi:MAG: integrase core domain-containing protein [Chloroflexota bacterium]
MRFAYHSERKTAFERSVEELGCIHGLSKRASPWQNAFVERTHRTDNEELFHRMRFKSSEERKYQLKLWEYEYNTKRPHQGLGGRVPMEVYLSDYRFHSHTRMLT